MERFTTLTAIACPLGLANVDTDQLIPARFMKRSRVQGYGGYLMHDLRFHEDGTARPGFVLDDPQYDNARILIARRNFGTGSSREAAVYALWDYGIRCVVAPSFGDIFASNAVKNGLLPATVSEADCETLLGLDLDSAATIDLDSQTMTVSGQVFAFGIDPVRRLQLLFGWDDIDLTMQHMSDIGRYRTGRRASQPWTVPDRPDQSS